MKATRTIATPALAQGHFSLGALTGILPAALGANSEIFQFRWAHASKIAIIRKISLSAAVSTTFFAAGVPIVIDLIKSSGWTGAGTGGTAITLGTTCKRRRTYPDSVIAAGDIRVATTAALGAGTKTLEANPISIVLAGGPITASLDPNIMLPYLWNVEIGDGEAPLILRPGEGLSIRSVAVPATGTWQAAVRADWAEQNDPER